ncbi:hypothetical protein [Pseudonocardia sp. DLS-67]
MAERDPRQRVGAGAVERAAAALEVTGLVDVEPASSDLVRHLQLAAAVAGAGDAAAMRAASTLAALSPHDPVPLVDEVAFRASGRPGSGVRPTSALWAIWNLRRTRARVGVMLHGEAAPELAAASAMLDAAYAALSAYVHGTKADPDVRADCLDRARDEHASAGRILDGLPGSRPAA